MLKFTGFGVNIELELNPEPEIDASFELFKEEEYFEPLHVLDRRSRGIVAQAILDNDAVILNENGELQEDEEEKPFFSQPIPQFVFEELVHGLSINHEMFNNIKRKIALGFSNTSDGFKTTWQWTYPQADHPTYPDMSIIDMYSPTFHKAVVLQSIILATVYKKEALPVQAIADLLDVDKDSINSTIKSGAWTVQDYADLMATQNATPGILKLLLTPAVIPGKSLHGQYNTIYSTAKVRTAFTTTISAVSQEIPYLDKYTFEYINWERAAKSVNNIYRTRFALLCQDAYLIKFLQLANEHTIN